MKENHEILDCRFGHGALDSRFTMKGSIAQYAPDRTFRTKHIRLELDLDIRQETLRGRCQTQLEAITNESQDMTFDAVNFKVQAVRWNGRKIPFKYDGKKIFVKAPRALLTGTRALVDIDYQITRPKLGLYFIKPSPAYPKNPTQVWTQGEDEYARYWFPCHDAPHERITSEVVATVPIGFIAVSNGRLVRSTQDPRTRRATFHWLQNIPHATYLVTLTAGRFSVIQDKWKNVPVVYYCEKGREEDARRAFSKTPKMMDFFSKFTGIPYPYAKYAQIAAANFIYGGMENTSATTQTDAALLDQRVTLDYSSDELVAHELAHQWFGDYLTCKDWSHAWLNESFATYFDALFKRHDKGNDEFLYQIRNNAQEYFSEDKDHYRRPICTKVFKRPSDLFDRHLYEKGSVVLFMLHQMLGEELFRKSIATYVRKNRGRAVETLDLIMAIEEATGRNPRRFFDQWVFGAGHPEFRIRAWWDARRKEMNIRITQTQSQTNETSLFSIQAEFLFLTSRGEKLEKVQLESKSHLFKFKLEAEPQMALFDPRHAILKKVDFPKPESWLINQLAKAKNPLDRMDAAHALARIGHERSLEALRHALLNDSFWGVQVECARALGSMANEAAALTLLHGLDVVEHLKVRRSIYGALRSFKSSQIAQEVEGRFRKEASYFAEAEGYRLMGTLRHPRASEILNQGLKVNSWNDVIRSAALEGLASTKSHDVIPLLLSYTRPGHSQRLRMAAIRSLGTYEAGIEEIQNRLIELTKDSYLLVQIAAVRVLQAIGDERAVPALKKVTVGDLDGRLKRLAEEAIDKITKGFESDSKA